jgi:hypothetical protein
MIELVLDDRADGPIVRFSEPLPAERDKKIGDRSKPSRQLVFLTFDLPRAAARIRDLQFRQSDAHLPAVGRSGPKHADVRELEMLVIRIVETAVATDNISTIQRPNRATG